MVKLVKIALYTSNNALPHFEVLKSAFCPQYIVCKPTDLSVKPPCKLLSDSILAGKQYSYFRISDEWRKWQFAAFLDDWSWEWSQFVW